MLGLLGGFAELFGVIYRVCRGYSEVVIIRIIRAYDVPLPFGGHYHSFLPPEGGPRYPGIRGYYGVIWSYFEVIRSFPGVFWG